MAHIILVMCLLSYKQKQNDKQVWMSGATQSTGVFYSSARTGGEIFSFCH